MYEHLPFRRAQLPVGPDMRLHRRPAYGTLADFTILDTRRFRDDQPCGDTRSTDCTARLDPDLSILGAEQPATPGRRSHPPSPTVITVAPHHAPLGSPTATRHISRR